MLQKERTKTIYYETPDSITLIEDVDDVNFFLFERERLANAMGYGAKITKKKTLEIYDEGELIGTYFSKQHMN